MIRNKMIRDFILFVTLWKHSSLDQLTLTLTYNGLATNKSVVKQRDKYVTIHFYYSQIPLSAMSSGNGAGQMVPSTASLGMTPVIKYSLIIARQVF